jgi:plastocyanin domain-containing protein
MKLAAILVGAIVSLLPMGAGAQIQHSPTNRSFQPIEQPLPVKVGVVLGGLTLVGAELWWFLGRKQQQQQAAHSNGMQEVLITVDGGYRPDRIVVIVDEPVRLSFDRLDRNSCLDEVLIPDFGISTRLPVGQTTTVEFTPTKVGEYAFTCGMRMFRGVILVRSAATNLAPTDGNI